MIEKETPEVPAVVERNTSGLKSPWKPGTSGNPKGRPPGTGKVQKALEAKIQEAAQLQLAQGAKKLLNDKAYAVTEEVLKIALAPPSTEVYRDKKTGKDIVTKVYGQAKVKCLLACFERIIPSLKVVELKEQDAKRAADMSDEEIVGMMERMITLAQDGTA